MEKSMTNSEPNPTSKLAQILMDLDRCEHGRHAADPCFACPGGHSTGNLLLPPGTRIGTDLYGRAIVVPPTDQRHEPKAWRGE